MSKLKTGRHKSAIKEARKNIKRYKRNVAIKSRLKTSIKKIEKLVSNKEHNISLLKLQLSTTFSQLDKAAKDHIIHLNKASNQKKRLSCLVTKIMQTK